MPRLAGLLGRSSPPLSIEFDGIPVVEKPERTPCPSLSTACTSPRRSQVAAHDGEPTSPGPRQHVVRCPAGHIMAGRIPRELWLYRRGYRCSSCSAHILSTAASYACKDCGYRVCLNCAAPLQASWVSAESTASSPSSPSRRGSATSGDLATSSRSLSVKRPCDVMPGDILLVGPDWWGIHHIVLCVGSMVPAKQHMTRQILENEPRLDQWDILECQTVESSRPLKGEHHHWYTATSYFGRQRRPGGTTSQELWAIGDVGNGTNLIGINHDFVPVKLLLHPCRPGHGGPPLDAVLFARAVAAATAASKRWSRRTALSAITSRRGRLQATRYTNSSARSRLMKDLRHRWSKGPICSSVAIQIWQRYFELSCASGPDSEDEAVQSILKWMPVLCDKTAPSALLRVLSTCGWVLCEGLGE